MPPSTFRYGWLVTLALLFAAAYVWRAAYLARLAQTPLARSLGPDGQVYWDWSERILRNGIIGQNPFFMGPLYPYALAALRALGLGIPGVLQLQCVLGAAAVCLLTDAARRLTSTIPAIAIGIVLAFYQMATFMDGLVLMESLLFFVEALLLWHMTRALALPASALRFAIAGVLIGIIAEGRATASLLIVPAALSAWAIAATPRVKAQTAAALAAGFLLVTAPVAWRNTQVSGEWIPITYNLGFNLYVGNNPEANGSFVPVTGSSAAVAGLHGDGGVDADGREYLRRKGIVLSPVQSSRYWANEAFRFMRSEPAKAVGLMVKKLVMFWNHREYPQIENVEEFRSVAGPVGWPLVGSFALLGPLALAGLFYAPRKGPRGWFVVAYVLVTTITIVPFFVTDRYRHHLVPGAALLAAVALEQGAAAWRAKGRALATFGAALGAATLVVFLPAPQLSGEEVAWGTAADLGARWLERDRPDQAVKEFERAIAIERAHPQRPSPSQAASRAEVYYDYARALERLGRMDEAIHYYERSVEVGPENAIAVRALAHAYRQAGRAADADRLLARVPTLASGNAGTFSAMGLEEAQKGHLEQAEALFADAVRLDPHAWYAWGALIRVRLQLQHAEDARQALDQAEAAGMPAPALHAYRGTLAAVNGDRATATRELHAAESAGASHDPVLRDVIAQAREMLGAP